jgi:uncharacterized protein (DUF488 family)
MSVVIKNSKLRPAIYTIGYQNLSIDLFVNILLKSGIKTVLDVRNKPFSYKYCFNYYWLNKHLPEVGIIYISIPELGIERKYRDTLTREKLWEYYYVSLEKKEGYLNKVSSILKTQPAALMCYEKNPDDCHRSILARKLKSLLNLPVINFDFETKEWEISSC